MRSNELGRNGGEVGSAETSSVASYSWNCLEFSIMQAAVESNTKAVMFDNPASFAES